MKRLFEDPQQAPELREDLLRSQAAGQDYPSADKLAQLRAALADPSRQPLDDRTRFSDAWRQLTWRTLHPGWKLAALLLLGGSAVLVALPSEDESAAPRAEPPAPAPPSPAETAADQPEALPATPEPALELSIPVPSAGADAGTAKSSRREIAQLLRIRALLGQDPLAAYRLAQRSEREFPAGVLSEERQALSIIALHKAGRRDAAAAKARDFFKRFPESTMRRVVEVELQ